MSALPPPSRRSRRENLPIWPRCKSQGGFLIDSCSTNQFISSGPRRLLCLVLYGVRQRNGRLGLAAVRIRILTRWTQPPAGRLHSCVGTLSAHHLYSIVHFETLQSTTHHHDRVITGFMTTSRIRHTPQIWRNPPSPRFTDSGQ